MDLQPFVDELVLIVKEASRLALVERRNLKVETKPDGSLVTNVDRKVEEFLRPRLTNLVPGSSVWGEEFGYDGPSEEGMWLVDPVDGTSNFSFGSPLWGISVGFVKDERKTAGLVSLPDLDEIFATALGLGVTLNGTPLPPIRPGAVQPTELVSYSESIWNAYPGQKIPGKMRCSGAIVVDGTFTACGRFRGMIGMRERFYDFGPIMLMGEELGADVRYAEGRPLPISDLMSKDKLGEAWIMFPMDSGFTLAKPN